VSKVDELRELVREEERVSSLISAKSDELRFEIGTCDADVGLEACVSVMDCNCSISKRTERQSRSVFLLEPADAVRFAHWILDVFGDS
jgi:hypothetical protein